MFLDLNKLHGQPEHFERAFQPSEFNPPDDDYRVATPVELSMDVEKAGGDAFRVNGRVTTRLEMECGRCLEPFEVPVDARFELRYVPQVDASEAGEQEIAEDDLITAYYREGTLDVIEMIREQLHLALPMKPLCQEACRGLCAECGTNLNRTDCGHKPEWEDPRLSVLKDLLNPEKEN
jgi:uncharacterized protein